MAENQPSSQNEALRDAAAMWLARMQRPDADQYRAEFEAWLAEPSHRAAYNKASSRFHDARMLAHSKRWARQRPARSRKLVFSIPLSILLITAIVLTWRIMIPAAETQGPSVKSSKMRLATASFTVRNPRGAINRRVLPDGSVVTIDTGTHLRISFTSGSRDLWLDQGRVRFAVAHDGRPFVVHAGGGTVTATGTLFDVVVIADKQIRVALLEGSVLVRSSDSPRPPRALRSGEAVNFQAGDALPLPATLDKAAAQWTSGMMSFDAVPLREVITIANRYAANPIEISDPTLAATAVSGRFRIDNADRLAANLAQNLDLTVVRNGDGGLLLVR
jgi:transmembrane sensor